MFDIIAAYQHQPAMAVDGGGVHDGEPRLTVPATGDERAEGQVADQPDDDEHDDQQDQRREGPQECRRITRARHAIQPLHWFPLIGLGKRRDTRPLRLATASCLSRIVNSLKHGRYHFYLTFAARAFSGLGECDSTG